MTGELELVGDSVQLGNSRRNSLYASGGIVVAALTTAKLQEKVDVMNQVGGTFGMKIRGSKFKRRMVYDHQVEIIVEDKDDYGVLEMDEVQNLVI